MACWVPSSPTTGNLCFYYIILPLLSSSPSLVVLLLRWNMREYWRMNRVWFQQACDEAYQIAVGSHKKEEAGDAQVSQEGCGRSPRKRPRHQCL